MIEFSGRKVADMKLTYIASMIALIPAFLAGCSNAEWKATAASPSDTTGPGTPVTVRGKHLELSGEKLEVGDSVPDVALVDTNHREVELASLKGKVVIISVVPAIATSVCTNSTLRLEEAAKEFGDDIVVLIVSADSGLDQGKWAQEQQVQCVNLASSLSGTGDFGMRFGLQIQDRKMLARAVLVVDRQGTIQYIETVGENTNWPDLDKALEVAAKLHNAD
jgi:thiol peroxidase